jgi:flagellar FliJ protein
MRFKFRFEALMNYRGHIKEKAEIALGRARRHLREARDELTSLEDRRQKGFLDLSESMKGRTDAGQLKYYSEYLTALKYRIALQFVEIEKREFVVKERLEEVIARTKEYRIIEKLKERDLKKWLHEQHLQEQKTLDENAVVRHGRAFL